MKVKTFLILFLFFSFSLFSKEEKEVDIKKLSEAIGHIIGKNLDELGLELDIKRMVKGIKKGSLKKESPMSEEECLKSLSKLQKKIEEKTCIKNLKIAEDFLSKNGKDPKVIELETNMLQYIQIKEGSGKVVKSYNMPIVRFTGKYLDGKIFSTSEELFSLNEILPGLKKAIIGMKEKEKRKIFIHPDLGFKTSSPSLNSLIIFEVEVIKVDGQDSSIKHPKEIANKNLFNENYTF